MLKAINSKKPDYLIVIIASLFLANGCVFVVPDSQSSPSPTISQTSDTRNNPTNETETTNSENLHGSVKLRYSVGGIIYESALKMDGETGKMLTTYFNPNSNSTEIVEQTMKLKPSAQGLVLLGYNPVDPDTRTEHPSYSPDNFLFRVNPDGSWDFRTCDDAERCSPVEVIK